MDRAELVGRVEAISQQCRAQAELRSKQFVLAFSRRVSSFACSENVLTSFLSCCGKISNHSFCIKFFIAMKCSEIERND